VAEKHSMQNRQTLTLRNVVLLILIIAKLGVIKSAIPTQAPILVEFR